MYKTTIVVFRKLYELEDIKLTRIQAVFQTTYNREVKISLRQRVRERRRQ